MSVKSLDQVGSLVYGAAATFRDKAGFSDRESSEIPTVETYEAFTPGSGVMPVWASKQERAVSVSIAPESDIDCVIVKPRNGEPLVIGPGSPYPPGNWEGPFQMTHVHTGLRTRPSPPTTFIAEADTAKPYSITPSEYLRLCYWPSVDSLRSPYFLSKRAPKIVQYLNTGGPTVDGSMGGESCHGRKRIGIHLKCATRNFNYYVLGFKFAQRKADGVSVSIAGNLIGSAAAPRVLVAGTTTAESWLIENETWDYVQLNGFFSVDATGRLDVIYDMRDDA